MPTGDPERFIQLFVRLVDEKGVLVEQVLRLGQRWDWGDDTSGRVASRIEDTRMKPGEQRDWLVDFPALAQWAGVSVAIEGRHVRMTAENAAYVEKTIAAPELLSFRPTLQADLGHFSELYPFATVFYTARRQLVGGDWVIEVGPRAP